MPNDRQGFFHFHISGPQIPSQCVRGTQPRTVGFVAPRPTSNRIMTHFASPWFDKLCMQVSERFGGGVSPVRGRGPWPVGPAAARTAGGCTGGTAGGRGTPPAGPRRPRRQPGAWGGRCLRGRPFDQDPASLGTEEGGRWITMCTHHAPGGGPDLGLARDNPLYLSRRTFASGVFSLVYCRHCVLEHLGGLNKTQHVKTT